MDSNLEAISKELQRITRKNRIAVLSGKVTGVDGDAGTAIVELTAGFGVSTSGVLLNAVLNNVSGMYLVPVDGADCEVANLDGPGRWTMIRASAYTKVAATIGETKLTLTAAGVKIEANGMNLGTVLGDLIDKVKDLAIDTVSGGAGSVDITSKAALELVGSNLNEILL